MTAFDLGQYSRPIAEILQSAEAGQRLMPLAPREILSGIGFDQLRQTSGEALIEGREMLSPQAASCVESALYLYFSALDLSHTISQSIETSSGSFLHGIMHRQEPDYGNSKYWFRRVGDHPLYPVIREAAVEWGRASSNAQAKTLGAEIAAKASWDPFWFVDQCEAGAGIGGDIELALRELQRLEWQLLFGHCYREAAGE